MDLIASTASAQRPPPHLDPGNNHRPGYKSTLVPIAEDRLGPNQNGRDLGRLQRVLLGTPQSQTDPCGFPEVGHDSGRNRLLVIG